MKQLNSLRDDFDGYHLQAIDLAVETVMLSSQDEGGWKLWKTMRDWPRRGKQ